MKILKAKNGKDKITFDINELTYIKTMAPLKELLNGEDMQEPIEVIKHNISEIPRMGAGGNPYIEKKYSLHKGSQRIQAALKLGYTHIEGVIINEH